MPGQVSVSLWGVMAQGLWAVQMVMLSGNLGVTLGAVSPVLTGRTPGEGRLKPVPLGRRVFGAEDVRYRTSRIPRQPPALVQT